MPIFCIDSCDYTNVKMAVEQTIRSCDSAILLPGACVSAESKAFKNIVFELDGTSATPGVQCFAPSWAHGISIVRLDTVKVEKILSTPDGRRRALNAIVAAIPNELRSRGIEVGPPLADIDGRDSEKWQHGFDSSACCAGIYSAEELKVPDGSAQGTARVHLVYYAVAKAGAGRTAQEFHAALVAAIRTGKTLDQIFVESSNGLNMDSIRRVETVGMRNRARIISDLVDAIGMTDTLTYVPDCANHASDVRRCPQLLVNSVTNSLAHVDASSAGYNHDSKGHWRYYAGSYDAIASDGIATCSNAADGIIAFMTPSGDYNIKLKNSAYDSLPFGSKKIAIVKELISLIGTKCKVAGATTAHPDNLWLRQRFGWKKDDNIDLPDVEPAQLWGTHDIAQW